MHTVASPQQHQCANKHEACSYGATGEQAVDGMQARVGLGWELMGVWGGGPAAGGGPARPAAPPRPGCHVEHKEPWHCCTRAAWVQTEWFGPLSMTNCQMFTASIALMDDRAFDPLFFPLFSLVL